MDLNYVGEEDKVLKKEQLNLKILEIILYYTVTVLPISIHSDNNLRKRIAIATKRHSDFHIV